MKVRCIDNSALERYLTVGAVYSVISETTSQYRLDGVAVPCNKWRFEILTLPCPSPLYPCPDPFACGELPKPAPLPKECKCGILRSMCDYHKD